MVFPSSFKKNGFEGLIKSPTGIKGFDEISGGGLPQGRPTLLTGDAGTGKTMFAMEFLVKGALDYNEPGVFITFEERIDDLAKNFSSVGFNIPDLISKKLVTLDKINLDKNEIEETGEFDLEGLFIRLGILIDEIGAKRMAIDTIEVLFSVFTSHTIIRSEIQRLFMWLKDRGITTIITGEKGIHSLTRFGLEEFVADCVIVLDTRIEDQIATRRIRILKYRGSTHGLDEYPFLIDTDGFSVLPITMVGLTAQAPVERVSSGVQKLDEMLDTKGYYRGSSILVSGLAGTGKTTIAASFVKAACLRGEKIIYFAFEESESQILRNMLSVSLDLRPYTDKGLLTFFCSRPSMYGLEMLLVEMYKLITTCKPDIVVIDPISNLVTIGSDNQVRSMLTRLIDFLKMRQITSLYTDLTIGGTAIEATNIGVSSLMDTWLLLGYIEGNGERNRSLNILKSRGMAHSNQVRELILSNEGISLIDVYSSGEVVLTGAARKAQEARDSIAIVKDEDEREEKKRALDRKRRLMEAQIEALKASFAIEEEEYTISIEKTRLGNEIKSKEQEKMRVHRGGL